MPHDAPADASVSASARPKSLPTERIYAREGASHVWLINPDQRTLEALRLQEDKWLTLGAYSDSARLRAEPFEAFELDLATLWADFLPHEG